MLLTVEQQAMLAGESGRAVQKALQILVALGKIYAAERLIPISSVQVAGVSYDNLGEAGLQFLEELAAGGGRARVLATLNPAGADLEKTGKVVSGGPMMGKALNSLEVPVVKGTSGLLLFSEDMSSRNFCIG